jgi:hypothetical protein
MELRGRFCRAKGIFGTMGEQAEKLRESNASWLRANIKKHSMGAEHCQIVKQYSNEYSKGFASAQFQRDVATQPYSWLFCRAGKC